MRVITRSLSNNFLDCTCQNELDLMGQGIYVFLSSYRRTQRAVIPYQLKTSEISPGFHLIFQ
jgi:hypothetical protein